MRNQNHTSRGAALFMTVLSTAIIVSLLGLSALLIARVERTTVGKTLDRNSARLNALSAIELALAKLDNDSNWRTTYTSGVETPPQSLGTNAAGTLSWIIEDTDGNLTDGDTGLWLNGVGRVSSTVQVCRVNIVETSQALDCLEVAVCSNGAATFGSNAVVNTDQTLHSNLTVSNSGTVNSDVEAVGSISGSGYNGTTTTPVPSRSVPAPSAFDHYTQTGTAISITSLPKVSGRYRLKDVVLSPSSNPYGPTNPEGIYVIDCGGSRIIVSYCRILGTLVLVNPSPYSDIADSMNIEPAVPNYPAVLVQGSIELQLSTVQLSEADRSTNFNPPGSPYQGSTDGDQLDAYPSLINGLIYVSADLAVSANNPVIDGVLVVGNELSLGFGETLTVNYNSAIASNPPPGFGLGTDLEVVAGTWRRESAP